MSNQDPTDFSDSKTLISVVQALHFFKIPLKQIARYTSTQEEDLLDIIQDNDISIDDNTAVENAVLRLALSGNHQCALSWLKNKAGWDDGKSQEKERERNLNKPVEFDKIEIRLITDEEVKEIIEGTEEDEV